MKKIISLVLSILLLGQSALIAQQTDSLSLAQVQKQAREDIKKAPWLQEHGVGLLAVTGTALGLGVAQHLVYQKRIKIVQQRYAKALSTARQYGREAVALEREAAYANEELLRNAIARERKTISELQAQIKATEEQLRITTLQKNGYQGKYQTQKAELEALRKELAAKEASHAAELKALEAKMGNQTAYYKEFLDDLTRCSPKMESRLRVWDKLFDPKVSQVEKDALFKELTSAPWLKEMTKAQRESFIRTIKNAMQVAPQSPAGAAQLLRMGAKEAATSVASYERLVAMSRRVFRGSLFLAAFLFVSVAASAHNNDDTYTKRINENFNLFLNATPEQLAMLEKNPKAKEACLQGAQALHEMAKLSKEEVELVQKDFSQQNTPTLKTINNY